jgi:hypothetical protein
MGKSEAVKSKGTTTTTTPATTTSVVTEKCVGEGCKVTAKRFNFCDEHYDHFKFGLIKKTGQPVSDYDKKYEHYVAHKHAATARKAA